MSVGTGLAAGREPYASLARAAVTQAMQRAGLQMAQGVLLFLTSEFARDPMPSLREAARAARCTQIMGCSVPGVFTEQDWVVDSPAAAAMVFGDVVSMRTVAVPTAADLLLALAAPNAINIGWLSAPGVRFGGVSGDATGQGPFSVWQYGRGSPGGHCEALLTGVRGVIGASHGVRVLTPPKPVTGAQGYDLIFLGGKPALDTLLQGFHAREEPQAALPLHRLMLGMAESEQAAIHGDYRLTNLVCANERERSVTVASRLTPGQLVFWVLRETEAAQRDLENTAARLTEQLGRRPDFGLMFSCLGRGPYFYDGLDRDLELLQAMLPGMPLIGFYGNGEIAPVNGANELLQYSAVLGLFSQDDA